jgi:hypothetical protein
MSQRLVTTDDHSRAEIVDGTDTTRANVVISRNGQCVTWQGLNLTDESWQALVGVLTDFLPGAQPTSGEDESPTNPEGPNQPETADQITPAPAPVPEPASGTAAATPASSGPVGRRSDSAQIRAWWYALSAADLKRLGLPTPKNRSVQVGKLPAALYDVYDQAHAA